MAHALVFTLFKDSGGDPLDLLPIMRSYIETRDIHMSDALDMMERPVHFIETLAEFAIESGNNSDLYDIGKFGTYDCDDCGASDLSIGQYDDDCDEEEEEE